MPTTPPALLRTAALLFACCLPLAPAASANETVPSGLDYAALARVGLVDEEVSSALEATVTEAFAVPASSVGTESGAISPNAGYQEEADIRDETDGALAATAAPADDAVLRELMADDRLLRGFERRLAGSGQSITNLPDVITVYYITLWEVVNDADASQEPSGSVAVRQQVGGAFSKNQTLLNLSDADKERLAHGMAVTAALAQTAHEQMAARGDSGELAQLRDSVNAAALEQGLDLRRLKLTTEGFIAY